MMRMDQNVCMVGLGYVGLPTSLLIADAGHNVVGFDVNPAVVKSLNECIVPIKEPGLDEILARSRAAGLFRASDEPVSADVFLIAVPTPITSDKKADLRFVEAASASLVPHLQRGNLVVLESTVPPGCTTNVVAPILERSGLKAGEDFYLAHCPERVLPGEALRELRHNSRVIGGLTARCAERARSFYSTFTCGKLFTTGVPQAEMVKLSENAYRDANLAFVHALTSICESAGVDVREVIELANHHPRVNMLSPGAGVGGHCIPVDPWFLIEAFPERAEFLRVARLVNDARPLEIARSVIESVKARGAAKVALLGITYKANVCDVRESPALQVYDQLNAAGLSVFPTDPVVNGRSPVKTYPLDEALRDADAVVGLVAHDQFQQITEAELLKACGKRPFVLDACGMWQGFDRGARPLRCTGSVPANSISE